jgi:threonine synthase
MQYIDESNHYSGLIKKYIDRLPIDPKGKIVSLGEGKTPLIKCNNITVANENDVSLYLKFEGLNPTGSFKDRGMTVAVTKAVQEGSRAIICASTGNTSASAAAYASRAGITAFVLIPDGKIAMGKLAQAMIHGAVVMQVRGNFDDGMRLVKEVATEAPVDVVNSVNPYRLQGQKTAAFEIIEDLGKAPDFHCLPVGNAGNITAHWIGYTESASDHGSIQTQACSLCAGNCKFHNAASINSRPIMLGYQAAGSAPFMRGAMVDEPETVATAIRIGHPQSWDNAWIVSKESGGWFDECADDEILAAQRLLAQQEGVFCEPASATSVAGALRDIKNGKIPKGSSVVCTLTGHGLKDPDTAMQQATSKMITIDAKLADVKDAILSNLS